MVVLILGYALLYVSIKPSTVGFRPLITQKAKCEFITLKHEFMNVYINCYFKTLVLFCFNLFEQ